MSYRNGEYVGVPKYENLTDGVNGVVWRKSLKSANDINGAVVEGIVSYGDDGVTLTADSRLLLQNDISAADRALLEHSGMIGFTTDTAALSDIDEFTETRYFLYTSGGNLNFRKTSGATPFNYMKITTTSSAMQFRNTSTNGRSRVLIYWTSKGLWVYIDDYLIIEAIGSTASVTAAELNALYIGGRNTTAVSVSGHGISDLFIIADKHLTMPILPRMRHINVYGDSKMKLGEYDEPATTPTQAITTRGEDAVGESLAQANSNDNNLLASLHRRLNAKGLFPGNRRIHVWAEAQSGVIHQSAGSRILQDRIDASLNGLYPIPNIAIIDVGTNDGADASVPIDAIWQADYATAIETLRDAGVDKIILMTQIKDTETNATEAQTMAMQGYINGFANTYPIVTTVDAYVKSGGNDMPASLTTDGTHPTKALYQMEAGWIAEVIN